MKTQCQCMNPSCASVFLRKPSEISRGRGKYCSKNCLNVMLPEIMKGALALRDQDGNKNPNWKGGIRTWSPTKQYLREKQRSYRASFPNKNRAHQLVSDAIREGRLTRKPCINCGASNGEAHHEDYSNPFDITWLCKGCHMKRHVELDAVMVEVLPRVQK